MSNKLFIQNTEIGSGLPILNKYGAIAKQRLIEYISKLLLERNYIPVASPHIGNLSLFETSGHYPYYKDSMFPIINTEKDGIVDASFVLKPMNCPFHIMTYKDLGNVSYKELPVKIYEFGQVYRNEDSGAINGLFRCRSFTQDDGHIFCTVSQINEIVDECVILVKQICDRVGFSLSVRYSKRDPSNTEKYVGDSGSWGISEDILKSICHNQFGDNYVEDVGGAAFYGPKIDFVAKDKLNREWQLGTIQLDFNLPERFKLSYIDNDGSKQVPVLIHRALLGSIERFLGVLQEIGIPEWLNPFNLGIIDITKTPENKSYIDSLILRIKSHQVYPTLISHPANLSGAIKKMHDNGIDNVIVIGDRDANTQTIMLNNIKYTVPEFYTWIERFKV
jgi:threonyl-tRNA synthetase